MSKVDRWSEESMVRRVAGPRKVVGPNIYQGRWSEKVFKAEFRLSVINEPQIKDIDRKLRKLLIPWFDYLIKPCFKFLKWQTSC